MSGGNPNDTPIMCVKNCGFFGNPATGNMCSRCFRTHAAAQSPSTPTSVPTVNIVQSTPPAEVQRIGPSAPIAIPSSHNSHNSSHSHSHSHNAGGASLLGATPSPGASPSSADAASSPLRRAMARCALCRKKVGLTGFQCRCSQTFCGDHRYPDIHNCSFDYKAHDRAALAEANPAVVASKITKI
eukprot:TRINITY_DN264_c0_g3_i2.p1 TRINITY_DN264_c0_g3~~TRINITY_DN264_c0_g3_i2.p1  ORF type:complete len:185 (+),score=31.32 TRINITY_DN264_c0_g3_i2:67-621(+)